jgi:hypothetical protein
LFQSFAITVNTIQITAIGKLDLAGKREMSLFVMEAVKKKGSLEFFYILYPPTGRLDGRLFPKI